MEQQKVVEEYPPEQRITIAMPFREHLGIPDIPRVIFQRFQEMCEATAKTGMEVFTNTDTTTSNTPITRMHIVDRMRGDWLLMVDADAFPVSADAVNRLLMVAKADPKNLKKIVAAPATRASYPYFATFGKFNNEGLAIPHRYGIEFEDKQVDASESMVEEVDYTGFHFILIHRSVFEAVPYPWFQLNVLDEENGFNYGHDVRFCRVARRLGFKIYIDYSVQVGHYGMHAVTLADHRMAVKTNPEVEDSLKNYSVEIDAKILDEDEDSRQYIIPGAEAEGESQKVQSSITVAAPSELIIPKEALK